MTNPTDDPLVQFSEALAARGAAAAPLVASIRVPHAHPRSATLWRADVAIASEQVFPKAEAVELIMTDGRRIAARVAGRDRGTNIVALRLDPPAEVAFPAAAEARFGSLALALTADAQGGAAVRLGVVRSLGPAWHSLAGGRIDQRITLDLRLRRGEEGGPVIDASGRLLGMSTAGPGGRALVIPAATIERVLDPLLAQGRIDRGWLGVALHPVALPEAARAACGQEGGVMVMQVAADGPAAQAGVLAGDILVTVDGATAARPSALARQFGPDSIGTSIELRLLRAGSLLTLTARITARPAG